MGNVGPDADAPRTTDHGAPSETSGRPATFDRAEAFVVRQPVAADETDAVRELVAEREPGSAVGTDWLLGGDGVATVTLFLEATGGPDALVWYVEVTDGRWNAPEADLNTRSPLFDAGLDTHLVEADASGPDEVEQVVHMSNPNRPENPDGCDVVMVRLGIRPGAATWIARFLAGAVDRLEESWIHRRFEASSAEVIEDERMWTETLWLERSGGGYAVRWYMEADEMDHVQAEYERSDTRVARWSNVVLNRVFEQPIETLDDPVAASDWELLAHATNPEHR